MYSLTYPGANLRAALRPAVAFIEEHRILGRRVLVHCSAGLSRSASVVVAWLMSPPHFATGPTGVEGAGPRRNLTEAVTLLTASRGRRLQINPAFWLELAAKQPTPKWLVAWNAAFHLTFRRGGLKTLEEWELKRAAFEKCSLPETTLIGTQRCSALRLSTHLHVSRTGY